MMAPRSLGPDFFNDWLPMGEATFRSTAQLEDEAYPGEKLVLSSAENMRVTE